MPCELWHLKYNVDIIKNKIGDRSTCVFTEKNVQCTTCAKLSIVYEDIAVCRMFNSKEYNLINHNS